MWLSITLAKRLGLEMVHRSVVGLVWGDSVDDLETHRLDGHMGDLPFPGHRDPKKRYDFGTRQYKYVQPCDLTQAQFGKTHHGKKSIRDALHRQ